MKSKTTHLILAGLFASATALPAANLIVNGSFETTTAINATWDGTPNELGASPMNVTADGTNGGGEAFQADLVTGWSGTDRVWLYNDHTGDSDFSDGVYAASIDARDDLGGSGGINSIDVLAQTGLSLTAGLTYTLSFDIWGGNAALTEGLDVRLTYGFSNELDYTDGTGLTIINEKTTVGNDGLFETVTVDFTPTVTNSNYAIQFFMDSPATTNNNHPYIDNVILTVPEPSSTALLGLGLSSLLLRRKRIAA